MSKPNKVCAECGKPYEICYICDTDTRFSWREVCCSVECYTEFLNKINGNLDVVKERLDESRNEETVVDKKIKKVATEEK